LNFFNQKAEIRLTNNALWKNAGCILEMELFLMPQNGNWISEMLILSGRSSLLAIESPAFTVNDLAAALNEELCLKTG